ncbi:MAG: hypothetical protein E3J21_07760 [Anaerolineales bacterium]|nr:MAG: hypothetical protein E3J21_07760 [Anaerolineales bacterium]
MPSTFGWVDFAEQDRQRMANVIHLFREQDTRDELGLGSVRDAFANLLFPGTSTIQTRAKYMLFMPWIYLRHEELEIPSMDIARKARSDELNLIEALLDSGDTEGVIGKDARRKLQRLPSSIYWSGLGTWGTRLFNGSQAQYHRYLDVFYRRRKQQYRQLKYEGEHAVIRTAENWDPGLPDPPDGFPRWATLTLIKEEAEYLHDRIVTNCGQSLLAFLVDRTAPTEVSFIWMHPELAQFPQRLRLQVEHARKFSEVMHGAALLYNLMLGEKSGREGEITEYRDKLAEWSENIRSRKAALGRWDRRDFWETVVSEGARIPLRTRRFVDRWIDLVLESEDVAALSTDEMAQSLIYDREVALKQNRARLQNQRALELWSGAAGAGQLDYRWSAVVNRIVNDILLGMENDA